jgi:hypothetical protein
MSIEEMPDKIQSNNMAKAIKCLNCGNERLITDQWLKDVSRILSSDSSNICESDIIKYSNRFYCSKCKKKNLKFIDIKIIKPPAPVAKRNVGVETKNKNKDHIKQKGKRTNRKFSIKGKKKLNRKALVTALKRKVDFDSDVTKGRKQLDREAYLAALERKKYRDSQTGGIPEYEDGAPRSEFGTRKEHKSMRAWKLG